MAADFAFGSQVWPGLAKIVEETGELNQVIGKIMAAEGEVNAWLSKEEMVTGLADEIADVMAALQFVIGHSEHLDMDTIEHRAMKKLEVFEEWHKERWS